MVLLSEAHAHKQKNPSIRRTELSNLDQWNVRICIPLSSMEWEWSSTTICSGVGLVKGSLVLKSARDVTSLHYAHAQYTRSITHAPKVHKFSSKWYRGTFFAHRRQVNRLLLHIQEDERHFKRCLRKNQHRISTSTIMQASMVDAWKCGFLLLWLVMLPRTGEYHTAVRHPSCAACGAHSLDRPACL